MDNIGLVANEIDSNNGLFKKQLKEVNTAQLSCYNGDYRLRLQVERI